MSSDGPIFIRHVEFSAYGTCLLNHRHGFLYFTAVLNETSIGSLAGNFW